MKCDGRLAQCPLKVATGEAIFAVLCGCGYNTRQILARLRVRLAFIIAWILRAQTFATGLDKARSHTKVTE